MAALLDGDQLRGGASPENADNGVPGPNSTRITVRNGVRVMRQPLVALAGPGVAWRHGCGGGGGEPRRGAARRVQGVAYRL